MTKAKHDRYTALFSALDALITPSKQNIVFLEVGTYNGKRAADLCRYWRVRVTGSTFTYIGFDLFENMTPETNTAELSKSTLPPSKAQVEATLKKAGAQVSLIKGNTRETVPTFVEVMQGKVVPDIIFIDGGHSTETIASDWNALQQLVGPKTTVLFDDYYENKEGWGCKDLITRLQANPRWQVELQTPVDQVQSTGLHIRMVRLTRNS